ncbi:ABC transporter permease [Devriesea agamarum]|uniref:hypothetical protein n=1 Tax=Devriesea agamarum TaxID=472569 RepID=UPI00071C7C18|nr:hypothetical protein [Devriesea agamarum]
MTTGPATSSKPQRHALRHPSPRRAKRPIQLLWALACAETLTFVRQPAMIALTLLLPAGLIAITAVTENSNNPQAWAHIAGRNLVAVQCITVYFVALNTLTARRHTLALKRLRTTALPNAGIITGLLVPPLLVGIVQILAVFTGLVILGAPLPQNPMWVAISALLGIVIADLAGITTSGFTSTPEKAQWTMMPFFIAAMSAVSVLPAVDPGIARALAAVPLVANGHLATVGWHSDAMRVGPILLDLIYMVAWIVILTLISWKTFRWERRH